MIVQPKTAQRFLHDLRQLCWQRCKTLTIYFVLSHETHGSRYVMNCQCGSKKTQTSLGVGRIRRLNLFSLSNQP